MYAHAQDFVFFKIVISAKCRFPPQVTFQSFNDYANMNAEDKVILPR